MLKSFIVVALAVVCVRADNAFWDPLGLAREFQPDQPIMARLTPAVQQLVPAGIQKQMARVTAKDLMGLREMAEKMSQRPTSRAEFIKDISSKAPNVLFLGTEVYKAGRDQYEQARKNLSPDALKFLRSVVSEAASAISEASSLFNSQDVGTKKNLEALFPFINQLIQSSTNSIQYVKKNF